jgi:hypothetical protein
MPEGQLTSGQEKETIDEFASAELNEGSRVTEQRGHGDLGRVSIRRAHHRLADAARPGVKCEVGGPPDCLRTFRRFGKIATGSHPLGLLGAAEKQPAI